MMRKKQFRLKPICASLALAFVAQTMTHTAQANPIGAAVVNGQASFATSGKTLTVTNTPGTIINWQGFSIGANEITRFAQQSASSAVLNRVIASNPSNILGSLQSNGRVFLVNPSGIVFGANATVNVAGMVASTLNISNADFLAGRNSFTSVPGAQNISNAGNITAQNGGQIYLIAPNVENTGIVNAPNGEILLAAGHSVELVNSNDPNLRVNITAPAGDATNVGQLVASSGSLGLFGAVVKNSGTVNANSATLQGGKIVFKASQRVDAGGIISAQGVGGGSIAILADMQSGTVNVTGTLDASSVAPSPSASLLPLPLAGEGNLNLPSPVYGRGAGGEGNGGFIETSAAHVNIADTARVTTASSMGLAGTWLIDPFDFTIAASGGNITGAALTTNLAGGNISILSTNGTTGTLGDVNVNDIVTWSANKLTLNAQNNININANLNGSGTASLALEYGQQAVAAGNLSDYIVHAAVNLPAGQNFSTKLGSDGAVKAFTVITGLGAAGSVTATDLQGMNGNLAGNYVLGGNIDATTTSAWNANSGFMPIGGVTVGAPWALPANQFSGTFDGLGHTILNLVINRTTADYVGLFGYTAFGSNIRNVGLVGGSVSGYYYVGSLAGYSVSAISNSYATGSVNGNLSVGGLVGELFFSNINNSYSTGSVSGSINIGGLVGSSSGNVSNSYHSIGAVSSSYTGVGGLIGSNSGTVSNSYYDINNVSVNGVTGAYVTTGGLYTAQFQDWFTNGLALNIANYAVSLPGSGNNYSISSVQGLKDLLGFSDRPYTFTLASNIDLATAPNLHTPYLRGIFDGAGHTISNLNLNQPFSNGLGMFGRLYLGQVRNVALLNVAVSGSTYVGGLVGSASFGLISNSYSSGSVNGSNGYAGGLVGSTSYSNITNTYSSCSVGSALGSYVGGLVGLIRVQSATVTLWAA